MALTIEPLYPWPWLISGLALISILLLCGRGVVDRWRSLGRQVRTRMAVLALSSLTAGLWTAAAFNPLYVSTPKADATHLAVVVDVSESIQRAQGGWTQVQNLAAQVVQSGVMRSPTPIQTKGTASIVTFGSSTVLVEAKMQLTDLPNAFRRLRQDDFASGDASDIAAGLRRAELTLQQAGGRGAVLLITDGNQTTGNALAAAQRLAQQGIPIHVLPITSSEPALAIAAADLPRQVNAQQETFLRGVMLNQQTNLVQATLQLARNPGLPEAESRFGSALGITTTFTLDANQQGRLRTPVQFAGLGLQFLDVALTPQNGLGSHQRRFFTLVNRPLKILAVGGDNRWTSALPTTKAIISKITPDKLASTTNLKDFDALVISAVPADAFAPGVLAHIASSVEQDGLGLLVINGGQQGAAEDQKTILMSYLKTAIDPLLPVSSEPRPFIPEPPPRQVVFVIDASGSMAGQPLAKAQQIARYIIDTFLRPQDRLDVLVFGGGTTYLINNLFMTDSNKQSAINTINTIQSGGGSDANAALQQLARDRKLDCGLIFISDGEIELDTLNAHPECRSTVLIINDSLQTINASLYNLADPRLINMAFDPASIDMPYFKPKPRDKFFEPGEYTPLPLDRLVYISDRLPTPALPLTGSAVTYLRDDADLIALRPKLRDPILAYRSHGAGYVGVFTTEIPDAWLAQAAGRDAVTAWVERLAAYQARDRYDFKVVDHGTALEMTVALVSKTGRLLDVNRLNATIVLTDSATVSGTVSAPLNLLLRAAPDIPATFQGAVDVLRKAEAQSATLVLQEFGPDQLSRPQRIPLIIPPASNLDKTTTAEAYSYGLNRPLLEAIAQAGGGHLLDPAQAIPFFQSQPPARRGQPLWPWLLVVATMTYLAAIAVHRLDI